MKRLPLVRYTTNPQDSEENETLSRAVFTELRERKPPGIAYALFRNGDAWTHLFVNLRADDSAEVTELDSFLAYQEALLDRCAVPPEPLRLQVELVDSYGLEV